MTQELAKMIEAICVDYCMAAGNMRRAIKALMINDKDAADLYLDNTRFYMED